MKKLYIKILSRVYSIINNLSNKNLGQKIKIPNMKKNLN